MADDFIPYGRQWIDEEDRAAVDRVLRSDFLTTGPEVNAFEQDICDYTGAKYCVAVSNATAGLHLAVAALDLPEGSEGITSPNTFVASANSLLYNRLTPLFADIDSETLNIDPDEIKKKIGPNTQVIIPVHFSGRACDMQRIRSIADKHKLRLIEDAAHAIGSRYADGTRVGNCAYSDMTVFSFHPVKTMTTGEGGAITTNDPQLYERLLLLRSHGITRDPDKLLDKPRPWYYEMQALGFNYRMNDIQAALGRSQLAKIERFAKRRSEIVAGYHKAFANIEWIRTPDASQDERTCFHLYVLRINWKSVGKDRAAVMSKLRAEGIGTQVLYIPVHTQPYYKDKLGYSLGDYPKAERYYEQALTIPLYPAMTDEDQSRVIKAIKGLV